MNKKITIILSLLALLAIILIPFFNIKYNLLGKMNNPLHPDSNSENFSLSTSMSIPYQGEITDQGGSVLLNVRIFKIGNDKRVDATLDLSITNPNGEIITKSVETFAIETQVNIVKSVHLPINSKPGTYIASALVSYGNDINSTAVREFNMDYKKGFGTQTLTFIIISLIVTIVLLVFVVILVIHNRSKIMEIEQSRTN